MSLVHEHQQGRNPLRGVRAAMTLMAGSARLARVHLNGNANGQNGGGHSRDGNGGGRPHDYVRTNRLLIPQIEDRHGRFVIREFNHDDLGRVRELNGDLFFAPLRHIYGPIGFLNAALKQQKQGKSRRDFYLAIADKETSEVIGSIMLYDHDTAANGQAEIAYFVDPSYQNINIATDAAVLLILRLSKEIGLGRLVATTHPKNKYSIQLLARLGFKQAGKEFTSKYKGDPDRPESYNDEGRLEFAPRIPHIVDYGHFLDQVQKGKIVTKPEDIDGIQHAREKRASVVEVRQRASERLQRLDATRFGKPAA